MSTLFHACTAVISGVTVNMLFLFSCTICINYKKHPPWSGTTLLPEPTGRKMSHFEMNNEFMSGGSVEDSHKYMQVYVCVCVYVPSV